MNNLNTIGQYLSSLQQNIAMVARGLADLKAEVESLKLQPQAITTTQPQSSDRINFDVSDMRREFDLFKMEVTTKLQKVDELKTSFDTSIESIFSSLQSPLPFPPPVLPNTDACDLKCANIDIQQTTIAHNSVPDKNDDIEIIAKKSPAPKKKPAKKA
jgi:hypothetical protein